MSEYHRTSSPGCPPPRAGARASAGAVDGGLVVGRCVGIAIDGGTAATYQAAGVELALATLAAIALVRDARLLGGRHA